MNATNEETKVWNIYADLGNYTTCVILDNGDEEVKTLFETRFRELDKNELGFGNKDIIRFQDTEYYIGEGSFEEEKNKVNKKTNILALLSGVCRSLNSVTQDTNNTINLTVMLPLQQITKDKDKFKNILKGNTGTYNVVVDGIERNITINNIYVQPEGLCLYFSLPSELLSDEIRRGRNILVIDVGGITTEFFIIDEHNFRYQRTYDKGMLNVYNEVANEINARYSTSNVNLTPELVRKKKNNFYKGKQLIDYTAEYNTKLEELATSIFKFITINYPSYATDMIVLAGGAAKEIAPYIEKYLLKAIESDELYTIDDIFANVEGAKAYSEAKKQL